MSWHWPLTLALAGAPVTVRQFWVPEHCISAVQQVGAVHVPPPEDGFSVQEWSVQTLPPLHWVSEQHS
jgi:hypothetical protein